MTDPWCCYIWCSMDPINKNPSHVSINIPAPAGSVMGIGCFWLVPCEAIPLGGSVGWHPPLSCCWLIRIERSIDQILAEHTGSMKSRKIMEKTHETYHENHEGPWWNSSFQHFFQAFCFVFCAPGLKWRQAGVIFRRGGYALIFHYYDDLTKKHVENMLKTYDVIWFKQETEFW